MAWCSIPLVPHPFPGPLTDQHRIPSQTFIHCAVDWYTAALSLQSVQCREKQMNGGSPDGQGRRGGAGWFRFPFCFACLQSFAELCSPVCKDNSANNDLDLQFDFPFVDL